MFRDSPLCRCFVYPKTGRWELREHTGEALFWAVSVLILSSGFPYWLLFLQVFLVRSKLCVVRRLG